MSCKDQKKTPKQPEEAKKVPLENLEQVSGGDGLGDLPRMTDKPIDDDVTDRA